MPLYNEAAGVVGVVQSLLLTLQRAELSSQVILVDNGSRDQTGARIKALAEQDATVECVELPTNAGYGGGILAGLERARAPIVGYLWGDEQVDHLAVVQAYRRIIAEGLDLCKAKRIVRLDGWNRVVITRVYNSLFPIFFPIASSDIHGCPKLFRRDALDRLRPQARDWFLDAEIMIKAQALGLAIGEIDVVAYPRRTGYSKVRWETLSEFAINLVRYRLKRSLWGSE